MSQLRVGLYYDGGFYSKVSDYYRYNHGLRSRLSIAGVQRFVRSSLAEAEGIDSRLVNVVDVRYFRGRASLRQIRDLTRGNDGDDEASGRRFFSRLENERSFEDVLVRAGVTVHNLPLAQTGDDIHEKGIDVWLALEIFEMAMTGRLDVVVLFAGDADYLPLVRKLHALGVRVMLLGFDFDFEKPDGRRGLTRTSADLYNEASYPVRVSLLVEQWHQDCLVGADKTPTHALVRDLFLAGGG